MKFFIQCSTFITLIISCNVQAASFYAYLENGLNRNFNTSPHVLNSRSIYTSVEKRLLSKLEINSNIIKFDSKLTLKELKKRFTKIRVEPYTEIQFKSYRSYQWYLENPGGSITRWITDIDTELVNAKPEEDINLSQTINSLGRNVRVAVVDSGIDLNHPDLIGQIIKNEDECLSLKQYKSCLAENSEENFCHETYANIDNNKNGYPLDCQGWSVTNTSYPGVSISGNPEIKDLEGHGTHVAGLIGAKNNGFGVDGITKNVKIIPIQVASTSSQASPIESIAKGILYAISQKADIINLSLGWRFQFDSKMIRDIVAAAVKKDILVVVAAGNDAHSDISYPCAYQDVICVGSHDQAGNISSFSNKGVQVDLIAPGTDILSTWPTTKRSKHFTQDYNYEYLSGTSQATPIVSGVLARLLSDNNNPNQARVKLLKGTRKKVNGLDIRFGNLDYTKSKESIYTSFIYPLNKEPALINYDKKDSKFILKLKNYGKDASNVKIVIQSNNKDIKVQNPQHSISNLISNEVYTQEIHLDLPVSLDSELRFNVKIISNEQNSVFVYRANLVRFIHPKFQAKDTKEFPIDKVIHKDFSLRVFDNITHFSSSDFFASRVDENSKTSIMILKKKGAEYVSSRELKIRDVNPVFLNLSKIDIDLDKQADYVISYVIINKEGNKITKFLIFDHNLKPKRILISPKNQFENNKTFIPGKFKWVIQNNKFVPAWIGYGENGTPISQSPWESARSTEKNYLYYLTEKGLQNFIFPNKEILLHTLYQNEEQKQKGIFHFLTSTGKGFFKTYHLYQFDKSPNKLKVIQLNQYFDIFQPRPLPFKNDQSSAFFNEAANAGDQNIFTISFDGINEKTFFTKLKNPLKYENIKYILSVTDELIFFQSEHKIGTYNRTNGKYQYRESKVNTKRRRLKVLPNTNHIYLASPEAPGFTSEILGINNSGLLTSHGQYRVLAINGCEEFGIVSNAGKDFMAFSCIEAKKLMFLGINKNEVVSKRN